MDHQLKDTLLILSLTHFIFSGTFPNDSDVYAGALGSGLKLLQPDLLKVSSNSLTIVGYDRPLLSACKSLGKNKFKTL